MDPTELQALWAEVDAHGEVGWRFHQLAELLDEVFYVFEPESSRVLYVSPAFERVWGEPVESLYRDPAAYLGAVVAEDLPVVLGARQRKLDGKPSRFEYRIRGAGGQVRWIWDRNFVVPGPPGRPLRVVGLAADVTEHRQAQESMRQMERLEALGHVGGGLAHDFNNILAVILGNLERLAMCGGDDMAAGGPVAKALEAARHGREIAASLLAFARRKPLQLTRFDLNRNLEQLLPLLSQATGSAVRIDLQVSDCPLLVEADAGSLDSALINLVANARDSMLDGGTVVLSSGVRRWTDGEPDLPVQLAPGDYAFIRVIDEGEGMRPEVLERALEPLFTTKAEQAGTGLGLPMAYGMLRRHGGTLTLDSSVGVGTQACLYLPLAADDACDPARVADETDRGAGTSDAGGAPAQGASPVAGGTVLPESASLASLASPALAVLAVEDDAGLRQLIELVLLEAGHDVVVAPDAGQALRALETRRYDVLVTDIALPGPMNGRRLASLASARWPGLRVVLASGGFDDDTSPQQGWSWLQKPYGPAELLSCLVQAARSGARER